MEATMIDNVEALNNFLKTLPETTKDLPNLYIDLEGNNLGREGTLSLITILVESSNKVFLIDVHTLGKAAFTTADLGCQTLQQILESKHIEKVFFDIRRDSDALFAHHGVRVDGIHDLQLMELGSRAGAKRWLSGLAKCIERDLYLSHAEKQAWKATKDQGTRLFAPENGGSYAVFDQRPLSDEILKYCVQDVVHMPALFRLYSGRLGAAWLEKIREETRARILLSQNVGFAGRQMALGPIGW